MHCVTWQDSPACQQGRKCKIHFSVAMETASPQYLFQINVFRKKSKKQNALADTLIAEVRGQEVLIGGCQLSPCDPQC